MKKVVLTIIISVLLAAILSFIYFSVNKDSYAVLGWGIYGLIYITIQLVTGAALKYSGKKIGQGLIIGAGIILLIGFSVCSRL